MRTKEIQSLQDKLDSLANQTKLTTDQLQVEYNKVFDADPNLAKAIDSCESSNEYGMDEYGEIYAWIRFDPSDYESVREYLDDWISDWCISIDWNNNALCYRQGDCITINDCYGRDDGDIYYEGKLIIDRMDYSDPDTREMDDDKRNELIETWMEKNGTYPGVFRCDSHGDVFPVKTTKDKV